MALMRQTVDARGLACPHPALMTKNALDQRDITEVLTIVDNLEALSNVTHLLATMEVGSTVDEQEGSFYINIVKETVQVQKEDVPGSTVILIKSNMLGEGHDLLGATLMQTFVFTLTQLDGELKSLLFMNSGVLLTTAGSELIAYLKRLERNGTEIISCGTCLDFYGLLDKLEVGQVGNMYAIVETMMRASKVIVL